MSDWSGPSEQLELQELRREGAADGSAGSRWYVAAFLAGILLVALVGLSTDLFDSGPTDLDVSAAFRDGFDQGVAEGEAGWEDALVKAWWDGYKRGQASDSSMAPVIVEAMRDGFSWESGFDAGLRSPDVDVDQRFRDGWNAGFGHGWTRVTGAPADVPPAPSSDYARRLQLLSLGDDP